MILEKYAAAQFKDYNDFVQNYHIKVPANFNFAFDCVDELAALYPDKTALVWCNDKGIQKEYSFSQMAALVDAAARYLSSLGIKKGDKVMLMLKRRAQFWFVLLGLIKLGAVAIPATHLLTKKDIIYRNNAASTKAIITVEDEAIVQAAESAMEESPTVTTLIKLGEARPGWHCLDEGIAAHMQGEALQRCTQNTDMMLLYFTSGTTGMPKMVAHNFVYPLGHISTARYWHNLGPGSLHLTVADTGWAKAAWGKIFGQWMCEAAVFVYDHDVFNAADLLSVVSKHKVTSFCAPPTVFRFMIKENLAAYDLSALQYVTTAGEPLNAEVFYQFKQKTGLVIRECYGQTEMTPIIITSPYSQPCPGSMGLPSPAYDVVLLNEEEKEVGVGEEGEICVKTQLAAQPGVFMGYYRDENLTKSMWKHGIYHTGDKAYKDDGGYYWYIGRVDDVIKSSGYRIGPFEVESALIEHPAVLECAVTAAPDEVRGQAVKASIVLAKGYQPTDELKKELQNHVKKTTAPYKYPRIVEFVQDLPKTISGKIQRRIIREKSHQEQKYR